MTHLTQIILTDRERWLLAQLNHVALAFLGQIFGGVAIDAADVLIIKGLQDSYDEIEALILKLNLDRIEK
jgi:hypothetical protein